MAPLPTYVECPSSGTSSEIQLEPRHWGHICDVYKFGSHDVALCVPKGWKTSTELTHYMFCRTHTADIQGAFMHSSEKDLTTVELMSFLYLCGYWRATIIDVNVLECGIVQVDFENVVVQVPCPIKSSKQAPTWPPPIAIPLSIGPFFHIPTAVADTDCVIGYGLTLHPILLIHR